MAIDIREISLSDDQKRRIASLAEETGRPWNEVLDEQLAQVREDHGTKFYWSYKDRYIEDLEKWQTYFNEWLTRRKSYNPNFDDSRDSIYR